MYDVIIVGARCAGSPTAMLLSRMGYKVLIVDKASFPSDTISTHILWPHGAEILDDWGLMSALEERGVPPIARHLTFDVGPFALRGSIPGANRGRGGFCPRRAVLDELLVNAAATSGAEVREAFKVESLLFDGTTVVGIRGRHHGGHLVEERARLVVGADGVRSFVAKSVDAPEYDDRPIAGCCYYSYFSGLQQDDIELFVRDHCAFGVVPTNAGLHLLMVSWPAKDFPAVRADVEGHVARALDLAPELASRVRNGRREEKWYGTAGVPSFFRKPYGDGWALVGDAGYNRDPITAQGMSDAFIDARALARAIDVGLSGRGALQRELAALEAARNERVRPMYEFSYHLAELGPPEPEMQQLFQALRNDPQNTNAFLSAITGAAPIADFMSPQNLERIVGSAGARAATV
jgi:2-polyprenyl-6-methoxyphenol hydroxylase-like FAD-dependent oxidoreductase